MLPDRFADACDYFSSCFRLASLKAGASLYAFDYLYDYAVADYLADCPVIDYLPAD